MIVVEYMENGSLDSFLRVQELNSLLLHTTPDIAHKQDISRESIF